MSISSVGGGPSGPAVKPWRHGANRQTASILFLFTGRRLCQSGPDRGSVVSEPRRSPTDLIKLRRGGLVHGSENVRSAKSKQRRGRRSRPKSSRVSVVV